MSFQGLRLLAGVAAACGTAAVLTAQQQPVFRAGVELVQIDAVVTDRQDRPVGGLTAADFTVLEDGRPQTIADFRPVTIPPATRTLDPRGTPSTLVSNDAPLNGRLFVFFVDTLQLSPESIRLPRELLTALAQGLAPNDQVAIVTSGKSEATLDLTADPVLQAEALDALRGNAGTTWGFGPLKREEFSLDILENVIESLAHSRHARRVVVYLSVVVPPEPLWVNRSGVLNLVRDRNRRPADAARRANVALYAVHPWGRDSLGNWETIDSPFRADANPSHPEFARESGGRAFRQWTDPRVVARQILDDNATFYVMSYYRDPANPGGTEPSIEVRAAGNDLQVRARRGYVAPAASARDTGTLSAALAQPLAVDGVRLRASVIPIAGTASEDRVVADITLEITYLAPAGATRIIDDLEFGLLALDYTARPLATRGRIEPVDLPVPVASADVRQVIRDTIELPKGRAVVRLGVASKALGRIGTVHVPVRVF